MDTPRPDRRRLLATALAGFGAALAAPRGAGAFSLEPLPAEPARFYRSACSSGHGSYHAQLVEEAVAALEAEHGHRPEPEQIETVLAALSCPLCGCGLKAS